MAIYILIAVVAYLIGSISFSVIFTKKLAGFDVREKGSKNAGSTNVLRTAGKKIAILTLICDIYKGVVAILFAKIIGENFDVEYVEYLVQIAGLAVVIGHTFPLYLERHYRDLFMSGISQTSIDKTTEKWLNIIY